jgi:tripartite-type tricarboxylate transporter receptor subunit TctC
MPLLTINQHLYKDMRFDPLKFAPVTILTRYPSVMLARSSLPVNTVDELVAYARKNPGKLTYASQGVGTIGHAAFERFKHAVKIDAVHVPYKGNGPALNDLIAGHVDLLVSDLIAAMPGIESGRIKLLAVGGEKRIAAFSKVQTISESVPDFFLNSWIGLVSTPKTPGTVTAKLADAIAKALADPAVSKRLAQLFAEPGGEGPQAMLAVMQRDSKLWADVIRQAKIRLQ